MPASGGGTGKRRAGAPGFGAACGGGGACGDAAGCGPPRPAVRYCCCAVPQVATQCCCERRGRAAASRTIQVFIATSYRIAMAAPFPEPPAFTSPRPSWCPERRRSPCSSAERRFQDRKEGTRLETGAADADPFTKKIRALLDRERETPADQVADREIIRGLQRCQLRLPRDPRFLQAVSPVWAAPPGPVDGRRPSCS